MTTHTASHTCDLCGLSLRRGNHSAVFGSETLRFCCSGCKMVYHMLTEASESPDPAQFRNSDLYRRCVAAGVVPEVEQDLAGLNETETVADAPAADSGAAGQTLSLQWVVTGMWCPACAWVIQFALGRLAGVCTVSCDFATDRLRCRYDPTRVDPGDIGRALTALGYTYSATDAQGKGTPWRREFVRLIITALLSANVMMLSWSLYSGFYTSLSPQDIRYISWPIVMMATAVMIYGGGPLFRMAWWGLRARSPGMEALVSLGAASAYLYSAYGFVNGSFHLYFDTACMLITLVLLGKLLEARAKARVRQDLEGFIALQPNKVRRCDPAFPQGRFVALDQLGAGDAFRVIEEEMVPADGEVVAGRGLLDASAVTGESRPQAVGPGQGITSGMRLIEGRVDVVAKGVGPQSLLGQMIAIIETSLSRPTRLESRTDRWLALFVPLMVVLAVATAMGAHLLLGLDWDQSYMRGLAVLVVACPCALGIAIPLARIAGISLAGGHGILVRDFEAFERTRRITCAVMDKTGTLTHGRWSLEKIVCHGKLTENEVVALAAGLEQGVEHAIARAVHVYARGRNIAPAAVTDAAAEANGVRGTFQGRRLRLGSRGYMSQGVPNLESDGAGTSPMSNIYMSLDGHQVATLAFGDQVRDSAGPLVQWLGGQGVRCHLISGDAHATTQAVARLVGISSDGVRGGQLPRDKAAYVSGLQSQGNRVVMVGDGINDAPALARADLSVALHHDGSLAQQAAAVTLMRGDPAQLMDLLCLSRRVNIKVVQNLGCAWIYNLISIPAAMAGWLNPLVAASAMLLSSLTVIGNTLLLMRSRQ